MEIGHYVKKPIVIEAVQWNGPPEDMVENLMAWGVVLWPDGHWGDPDWPLLIDTLEGKMRCVKGDYIIRGIRGEFYPIRKDIFEESYEEVVNA